MMMMSTRARGKRRGPDPQQLTLFAYQGKKSRVESGSESSDCDPLELSDDKSEDNNDDDSG